MTDRHGSWQSADASALEALETEGLLAPARARTYSDAGARPEIPWYRRKPTKHQVLLLWLLLGLLVTGCANTIVYVVMFRVYGERYAFFLDQGNNGEPECSLL